MREKCLEDLKGVTPYQNSAAIEENRPRVPEGGLGLIGPEIVEKNSQCSQ